MDEANQFIFHKKEPDHCMNGRKYCTNGKLRWVDFLRFTWHKGIYQIDRRFRESLPYPSVISVILSI